MSAVPRTQTFTVPAAFTPWIIARGLLADPQAITVSGAVRCCGQDQVSHSRLEVRVGVP